MKYTAVVIGLGQIGLMYDFDPKRETPSSHCLAYELDGGFQLIAAADLQMEKREQLELKAPNTRFFQDYKEMLKAIPRCNVVSICTPPSQHLRNMEDILKICTPQIIFCEKPVAANLLEAQAMRKLARNSTVLIVPNLTRRFLGGMQEVKNIIVQGIYGKVQKINARYTRGIFNTGAHLFDLIRWYGGEFEMVKVLGRADTSSDKQDEPTYSFIYATNQDVHGIVEAFNDRQYYLFELDVYMEAGKIEIRNSGDEVNYYRAGEHSLFSGMKGLNLKRSQSGILSESALKGAIRHFGKILQNGEKPFCDLNDAIQPLYVAEALQKSAIDHSWIKVGEDTYE